MSLSSSWDLCIHKQAAFSEGYSCFSLKVVYLKFPKKKKPPKKVCTENFSEGDGRYVIIIPLFFVYYCYYHHLLYI